MTRCTSVQGGHRRAHRRTRYLRKDFIRSLTVGITVVILSAHSVGVAQAVKTTRKTRVTTPKTTQKATPNAIPAVLPPVQATIPLASIGIDPSKKAEFCSVATDTRAKLADLRAKKSQLGSTAPPSIYLDEIDAGLVLEKVSPKELAFDYSVLRSYTQLFVKLASTKDSATIATVANQLSDETTMTRYFDSTVRIEAFVRRSCGFAVGI